MTLKYGSPIISSKLPEKRPCETVGNVIDRVDDVLVKENPTMPFWCLATRTVVWRPTLPNAA